MNAVAEVKETLTGDETKDDRKSVWSDAHLWTDFNEEKGIFIAQLDKTILRCCWLKLKKWSWSIENRNTVDCMRWRGGGSSPSGVTTQLSIQLLKSWQSSHCSSINFVWGALFSSSRPCLMRSCFDTRETCWRIWVGEDELWEWSNNAGWIISNGKGFVVANRDHTELVRPPNDDPCLRFSDDSERELVRRGIWWLFT